VEPGHSIELKAQDEYWGTKPAVKEARFIFVKEDTTRVSMLRAGEADMILECPFPMVKEVEAAGFRTARLPTHPSTSVQFHTYNPKVPWHDKRVRQAVAHAIDRNAIVTRLFQGIPSLYARLCPWSWAMIPISSPIRMIRKGQRNSSPRLDMRKDSKCLSITSPAGLPDRRRQPRSWPFISMPWGFDARFKG